MSTHGDALELVVRGRTFRLNAPAHERDALADAIAVVQSRCDEIARAQTGADSERVLLLAALELAALGSKNSHALENVEPRSVVTDQIELRLTALHSKLIAAITA
jgi:cell division protein ZapA (FtsZ GTPase activity inhibitor)